MKTENHAHAFSEDIDLKDIKTPPDEQFRGILVFSETTEVALIISMNY